MQIEFNAHRRPDTTRPTYELTRNGRKFGAMILGTSEGHSMWHYFDDQDRARQERVREAMTTRGDRGDLHVQLQVVRAVLGPSAMQKAVAACEDLGRRQAAEIAQGKPLERAMALLESRLGRR